MKRIMLPLILMFVLVSTWTVYAELIDGPANIRDEPQGQELILLNDGVLVDSSECMDDWHNIGLMIYFDGESHKDGGVAKNSILHDAQANQIGIALTDLAPSPWLDLKYDEGLDRYYFFFHGYTHKDNIKENSTVEDMLLRTLIENQNNLSLAALKQHIDMHEYYRWSSKGDFETYLYYEFTVGLYSKGARLILFFYNGELVAILHNRDIDYTFEDKTTIRGYNFGYIGNIERTIKEQLEEYYFPVILYAE